MGAVGSLCAIRVKNLAFETNEFVNRLNSLQPFDADFSQIYFEHADHRTKNLLTRAETTVRAMVDRPDLRMIVLTGDAGHGKTHLCARVLADLRQTTVTDVAADINKRSDGTHDLQELEDGRHLRIIKDLSEMDTATGASRLIDASTDSNSLTIVCANEGRLRSAIAHADKNLEELGQSLTRSFRTGSTSSGSTLVAVIDLNHQSVAADTPANLVQQVLANWVIDEDRWSICKSCEAAARCPILENKRLLSSNDERGQSRRASIEDLLRIVERIGVIITIRELLIVVAHLITAGLRCRDVQEEVLHNDEDRWQWNYLYHQVVFGDQVPPEFLDRLDVFGALRKLDPGLRAIRAIDDALDVADDSGGRFRPPYDQQRHAPKTRQQHHREQEAHRDLWRTLRRRSFFESFAEPDLPGGRERLGLDYVSQFEEVVTDQGHINDIRNDLLRGLEAIQGIRRGGLANLIIVDPAFSSPHGPSLPAGVASVIAGEVPLAKISVSSQSRVWEEQLGNGEEPDVPDAVDWLERRIVISLGPLGLATSKHYISLDLRDFEFVMASAHGLSSRQFFAPEARRILHELARLASAMPGGDEVRLFTNGAARTLLIDGDQIHQVS